jgi:N,N'-diacetyllegionaminate synthase
VIFIFIQKPLFILKGLVDLSKEAGANGVKFQVLTKVEEFISTNHTAFDTLSGFCLTEEEWSSVFDHCLKQGLDIIAMPLNISSFKLLENFKIRFIDIHSVSFNDEALKHAVKNTMIPVLLSSGGRTLEELDQLYSFFGAQLKGLLVGFQAFPSKLEEVKLSRITFLKNKFKRLEIGYADHSEHNNEDGIESNLYARLLGASIFEKHITLEEGDSDRVDYISAIGLDKLKLIIRKLKRLDKITGAEGKDLFNMPDSELTYRNRELKVVSKRPLVKNTTLKPEDLCLRMIDQPNGFSRIEEVVDRQIAEDLDQYTLILKDKLL